jgi:hypothetical protein
VRCRHALYGDWTSAAERDGTNANGPSGVTWQIQDQRLPKGK